MCDEPSKYTINVYTLHILLLCLYMRATKSKNRLHIYSYILCYIEYIMKERKHRKYSLYFKCECVTTDFYSALFSYWMYKILKVIGIQDECHRILKCFFSSYIRHIDKKNICKFSCFQEASYRSPHTDYDTLMKYKFI